MKENQGSTEKRKVMLKEVRERQGLSQQELAKRIGIERARYSDLERGKISKWLIAAIRLNEFLAEAGYSLDDLMLYLPSPSTAGPSGPAVTLPENSAGPTQTHSSYPGLTPP